MQPDKIAVGYLRCSTEMQEDSTDQQRAEIQRYADKNGYKVIGWYTDEAQSGTTFLRRPAFVEMLNVARSKQAQFQYILVYDESRWGRAQDLSENSYWKSVLRFEYNIQVVIVKTNSVTGNQFTDRIVEFIESAQASEFSWRQSVSTLRGCKDNASKGFSSGGSAPYGYKRIAINKTTRTKIRDLAPGEHITEDEKAVWALGDPEEVEIVKRMFECKIKGMGYVPIADMLNGENIPPPKRGRWRNKNQRWSGISVRTILANPTYYGVRVYNRFPQSHISGPEKKTWLNPPEEWVIFENAHPAIVSKEAFELANRDRKPYQRKNHYYYSSPYLLSGLIVCGHCGFNFQGQNFGKKKVRYYEDGAYVGKGKSVCTSYRINKQKLESFVIKAIRNKILNSDLPKRLEEMLDDKVKHASVQKLQSVEHIQKQLTEANLKIERLLTLAEMGVSLPEQADKLKKADKEKKELEKRLEELKLANLSRKEIVEARAQVQYLMDNFEEVLKNSPVHVQKELLRKFIHKIVVDRESDTIITYLKKIPSATSDLNGNAVEVLGCVEVKLKLNKKPKSAEKQPTEPSSTENKQVNVLTESR